MPFGGVLCDVESMEPLQEHKDNLLTIHDSDDMSDAVLELFFAPSTCCAGTFPDHAKQNYYAFCKGLTQVPLAEPFMISTLS